MMNKIKANLNRKNILTFSISFLSFSALLFSMLCLSIMMDRDTVQTDTPTSGVPIKNDAYYSNMQDAIHNILLTIENDDGLSHMAIVSLQPQQNRTIIMPLPYNIMVSSNGSTISAAQLYGNQGINRLCDAISNSTTIDIDRYISCTDEQFGKLIEAYSSLTLNIDEDVDFYYDDIPLKLTAGSHILDGQTASMLLYNEWASFPFGSEQFFGQLLCSFFDKAYTSGYITDDDRFNDAINYASTDISYLDYLQLIQNYENQDIADNQTKLIDVTTYIDRYSKTIKKDDQYTTILLQYFFIK